MGPVEKEARRAMNRLRRSVEKAERELEAVSGSIRTAEGSDFPVDSYDQAREWMRLLQDFTQQESARLQMKILESGGLEPGRVRRASSVE